MDITSCTQTEPQAIVVTSTKNTLCGCSLQSAIGNVSPWLTYSAGHGEGSHHWDKQPWTQQPWIQSPSTHNNSIIMSQGVLQEGDKSKLLDRPSRDPGIFGSPPSAGSCAAFCHQSPLCSEISDSRTVALELRPSLRL